MIQETCFFKVIQKEVECLNQEGNVAPNSCKEVKEENKYKEFYMPCNGNEKGAIKMNFNEIPKDQILFRKLNLVIIISLKIVITYRLISKKALRIADQQFVQSFCLCIVNLG